MEEIKDYESKIQSLESFIDGLERKDGALIAVLHKAQSIFGYLPVVVQEFVAEKLNVTPAKVFGVVTFYSYFKTKPVGKYSINVCTGTACFVLGAQDLVDEFSKQLNIKVNETTPDGKFTLQCLRCIGACALAPVVTVNEDVYGKLKPSEIEEVLAKYNN